MHRKVRPIASGQLDLDFASLQLVHEVIAGTNAQGHDRQRGILAGIGSKTRRIHHKQVLDVVRLLKLIQH